MDTLDARLMALAVEKPDHPAVLESRGAVSRGALAAEVGRLATRLREAGIGRGHRVAVAFTNGTRFVTAFFAVARRGGIVVPLHHALTDREMAAVLDDGGAALVLAGPPLAGRVAAAVASAGLDIAVHVVDDLPEGGGVHEVSGGGWPESLADPGATALCLYSSGSTGRPKRVERTQGQLVWEADRLIAAVGMSPQDRVLGAAPFAHTNGLMRSMVASSLSGATLVPVAQFERRAVGRMIQEHAVTVFIGVPFMFAMLAETRWPAPVDLSSLRLCLSSSAPLKIETMRAFRERYGVALRQLYGSTETGTIALDLDDGAERAGCMGRPLDGVEVQIFGDAGQPLPPGEAGDIGIRSPAAVTAYVGRPDATAASFRDGYFFPGDVGRTDAAGRVYLEGRKSLLINRGGFKVNPYEIEELLETHPKVAEAAVVGVASDYGDQLIKAVVVLRESCDESEIVEYCRGRVADFKIPSIVEVRAELPKSSAGKVLRGAV